MISSQGFYPARVLGISNQKKSQNTSSLVTWLMVRNQETPRLHVHQYLWSEVGPYPTWHHRKPHTASPKFRRLPQDSAPTWDVSSAVAGWCVGHTVFHVWWPLETYKHMKHINLAWHLETRLASEVSGPFPTSSKAVSSCCEISVSFEDLVRRESQNRTNLSYSCWFQGFYSMKVLRLERLKKIFFYHGNPESNTNLTCRDFLFYTFQVLPHPTSVLLGTVGLLGTGLLLWLVILRLWWNTFMPKPLEVDIVISHLRLESYRAKMMDWNGKTLKPWQGASTSLCSCLSSFSLKDSSPSS